MENGKVGTFRNYRVTCLHCHEASSTRHQMLTSFSSHMKTVHRSIWDDYKGIKGKKYAEGRDYESSGLYHDKVRPSRKRIDKMANKKLMQGIN